MRVQVSVSNSPPLVGSQESHQEKSYKDVFMDGNLSSAFSRRLLHYPLPAFTYSMYKSK
ncbi:hypothetical protein E2C01_090800 [Portunus trituberculatus]|uniref:Uncharacterized protein n=1 Tax=Portunus trituberculatus TaxID=210409 RepID=A0A5B7JHK2_PORTR|nr:hypothetical protein [Portunus trituberculatus]